MANKSMTKKELTLEIIERLKKEYPDAGCTLDYNEAWKLLVSVRLAAQCTDARVNVVVEDLYAKYPDVNALADAQTDEIEKRESDYGRCVWKTCHRHGYPLYPPGKPHGPGRRYQRPKKSGNGFVEAGSPRRRKRFLPQTGVSWP